MVIKTATPHHALSYWRLVVSQILTKISYDDRLQTIIKKLPITFNTFYLTIPNAFKNKTIVPKTLRETISNSINLRRQHLSDLALALELNGEFKQGKSNSTIHHD